MRLVHHVHVVPNDVNYNLVLPEVGLKDVMLHYDLLARRDDIEKPVILHLLLPCALRLL